MSQNQPPRDARGPSHDATTGGGASADRGGRDAGMPAPASMPAASNTGRDDDSTGSADTDSTAPPPGSNLDKATSTVTGGEASS